eukprot:872919_1
MPNMIISPARLVGYRFAQSQNRTSTKPTSDVDTTKITHISTQLNYFHKKTNDSLGRDIYFQTLTNPTLAASLNSSSSLAASLNLSSAQAASCNFVSALAASCNLAAAFAAFRASSARTLAISRFM